MAVASTLNAHWTVLDDGLVISDALWPPDSPASIVMRQLGRELSGSGLLFHWVLQIFGVDPRPFYLLAALFVGGTALIVYLTLRTVGTPRYIACAAGLMCLLSSTAPENYLTVFKLEPRTSLVSALVIYAVPLMSRSLSARPPWHVITVAVSIFAIALAGTWIAKEIFFLAPIATLIAFAGLRLRGRGNVNASALLAVSIAIGIAIFVGLIWRANLAPVGPRDGAYTELVMDWRLAPSAILDRARTYLFRTPDVAALLVACVLGLGILAARRRVRSWGAREAVGILAAVLSLIYASLYVFVVSFKQIYYLYPAAVAAAIGLAATWDATTPAVKRGDVTLISIARIILILLVGYSFAVAIHLHLVRAGLLREAQAADAATVHALGNHQPARAYLSYTADSEMVGNVQTLLAQIYGASTRVQSVSALEKDLADDPGAVCDALVAQLTTAPANILFGARGLHYQPVPFDQKVVEENGLSLEVVHNTNQERSVKLIGAYVPDYTNLIVRKPVQWRYGWHIVRIKCQRT